MIPTWVAVVTAIGGLIVSAAVTPFVTLRIARRGDDTARRGQDVAKSQSDRDLILTAAELARSDDVGSRRQGEALLDGLAMMTGLSRDDALLVESLTRAKVEAPLSRARATISEGDVVRFVVDAVDPAVDVHRGGSHGDDQRD